MTFRVRLASEPFQPLGFTLSLLASPLHGSLIIFTFKCVFVWY